jgi:hypothetical protein
MDQTSSLRLAARRDIGRVIRAPTRIIARKLLLD